VLFVAIAGAQQPTLPPYSPGMDMDRNADRNANSAPNREATTPAPPPSRGAPLAYSASRSETALRVEDLMRGAAAIRAQGNLSKAVNLYNEALTIAPRYAEGYRQRALTLVRLGDRVQAQVDYNRFLALDPQAPDQVQEEVILFEQSGRGQIGQPEAAAYRYGAPIAVCASRVPPGVPSSSQQLADASFSWAQDAFQDGRYDAAFRWAANSDVEMPQARTRALIAQILLAQGDFRGAAAKARAAVAMGPVIDWRALYSHYDYAMPRFSRHLHTLKEFVRQNPSSADGHFLLGYEHLILGQAEPAHAELAIAAVIEPSDVVAVNLLAKDGVEIVNSHRPLAQAVSPRGGVEVARLRPTAPGDAPPPPLPRSDLPPTTLQTQKGIVLR